MYSLQLVHLITEKSIKNKSLWFVTNLIDLLYKKNHIKINFYTLGILIESNF